SYMTAVALGLLDQASLVVNPGQGSGLWVFQIIDIRVHDRVAGGAELLLLGAFEGHKITPDEKEEGNDAQTEHM
ncbi:MAG: hypothetical protein O7D93_08470, partial [Acidobacteria bacterium]|nr:hypothetical protein [Acidobacteriota bacterium]